MMPVGGPARHLRIDPLRVNVHDQANGRLRRVLLSHDGSRIVFSDGSDLDQDVLVMDADGSDIRHLTDRRST